MGRDVDRYRMQVSQVEGVFFSSPKSDDGGEISEDYFLNKIQSEIRLKGPNKNKKS